MRRLQLQVKKNEQNQQKKKKKESGVSVLDILKHQQQQTEQNLVFLWSRTNKAEWLTVRLRPHPTSPTAVLKAVAFTNLNGSWKALALSEASSGCNVRDHPAVSTQALTLRVFTSLLVKALKWCRGRRAKNLSRSYLDSRGEHRYCIWLPHMLRPVWEKKNKNQAGMEWNFFSEARSSTQRLSAGRWY